VTLAGGVDRHARGARALDHDHRLLSPGGCTTCIGFVTLTSSVAVQMASPRTPLLRALWDEPLRSAS
jgi:hypothetical protein